MTSTTGSLLLWAPRVLGAAVSMFLGLFALDVFNEGEAFSETLAAFAIHVAPAVLLFAVVAASWNREWVGGILFTSLGVAYMGMARGRFEWILGVSAPLLIVGLLFLWSWRYHKELHRPGRLRSH